MNNTLSQKMIKKYHSCHMVTDLKDLLYKSAERYPNNKAFKLKDSLGNIYPITYTQFKTDVIALGTKLIELGLMNKKIAVIGKNSYNWAVSYMVASIIGIVVPIDKELHSNDIINFLNVSETSAILGDDKYINLLFDNKQQINNSDILLINFNANSNTDKFLSFNLMKTSGSLLVEDGDTSFDKIVINPDELHFLLFTSGTTGNAKGVCLSHKNICSNIRSVFSIVKVHTNEQVLSILPIHHTYECTLGFLLVIYSGGCIAFCEGLKYITKNIAEFKPTIVLAVPLLLEKMYSKIESTIKKSLPKKYTEKKNFISNLPFFIKLIVKMKVNKTLGGHLNTFIVGAAPLNPDLVTAFNALGFRTLQGYGLTECSPLVAGNNDFYSNPDAVGLPIENVEYKIDAPNESGVGEILVKGPNVMLGYYNMPEETNKVLRDGWFYTGDLGRIDEQGWLYVTGRCKTVIITKNGKNIYPEELEHYLNDDECVLESLVTGEHHKNNDETFVTAQIVPNIDYIKEKFNLDTISKENLNEIFKNIVTSINSNLPNYKHIKDFIIRDTEFEKTTTQKIKRYGNNINKKA